jgi:hypothetical protein
VLKPLVLGLIFASLLAGCIYYPRKVQFYDETCQIVTKKLVLEGTSVGSYACVNEGCLIAMIPAAASAIISGSIVVVGNVVYWLEKQGECRLREPEEVHP